MLRRTVPGAPPIVVDGRGQPPLGMSPAKFLRDYWQKHPLLIRQAFPGFQAPLDAHDLAGLACEPYALSRLIVHDATTDSWQVEHGPFEEERFAHVPERDWTLLVQDVDKWDRDVAALLEHFRFLPDWRVDDVMISYAAPDGSVGAHVDQYDVFLLQGNGQRHWAIDSRPGAPQAFRPDQDLRLLQRFDPDHDWVLEPGDMLYLPPGVPHHGVAVGDERCLTLSVGLRAPAVGELVADFADHLAERLPEALRYSDPDLRPAREPGQIDAVALARVRELLRQTLDTDDATVADWFGRFITRYRAAGMAAPRAKPYTPAAFSKRLSTGKGVLVRHPLSRFAWQARGRNADLFVAGDCHRCTPALARLLCDPAPLPVQAVQACNDTERELLRTLVNAGHLEFGR
ncbi:cupin domain-containing protein [Pseudofulvimonas gallinarii]|uniref:50S ribosomal protein L16 3-hydroxylase n=1 Tax=Pseudofulvimonas gallinarii TaxID=634155 RepID=A0A4S3KTG1_9GAMM|nr:cupin domain-containing protein [Pseudofulvimonas gallinarii]TCS92773.1 50S ribosomal protein L16 3-hydroxylase [Pseudofulvimonas gallinarii]THD12435.1 transcription factor [Pseudofulvimonas gallinarii]